MSVTCQRVGLTLSATCSRHPSINCAHASSHRKRPKRPPLQSSKLRSRQRGTHQNRQGSTHTGSVGYMTNAQAIARLMPASLEIRKHARFKNYPLQWAVPHLVTHCLQISQIRYPVQAAQTSSARRSSGQSRLVCGHPALRPQTAPVSIVAASRDKLASLMDNLVLVCG
jgi:hypothetical protein